MSCWFWNETTGVDMPSVAYRNSGILVEFVKMLNEDGADIPYLGDGTDFMYVPTEAQVAAIKSRLEALKAFRESYDDVTDGMGSWMIEFFDQIKPGNVIRFSG